MTQGRGRERKLIVELSGPPYRISANVGLQELEYLDAYCDYKELRRADVLRELLHRLQPPRREGKVEDELRAAHQRMMAAISEAEEF